MYSSGGGKPILKSPFIEDVPRAFQYTLPHVYGAYAKTIISFAHYHNYVLQLEPVKAYRTLDVYQKIESGHYNISVHGSGYVQDEPFVQFSYPVGFGKCCVLVPVPDEVPRFLYVIWPFGPYIWLTLLFAVFYIAILLRFLEYSPRRPTHSISYNMLQSIAIIFTGSNLHVGLQNRPVRMMYFYTLLLVLSFILSVFHQTHMTSYCMKPVLLPPPNSIADIQRTEYKLLVSISNYEEFKNSIHGQLNAIEAQIETIEWLELWSMLEAFNNSVGYMIFEDLGKLVKRQQTNLLKPYFFLTSVCVGSGYNAFSMNPNKHMASALKGHILAVQQAGLWDYWENQAFEMAVSAKKAKILIDFHKVRPMNLEFFILGWSILAVGLCAATCTAIIEVYYWKIKLKAMHVSRKLQEVCTL